MILFSLFFLQSLLTKQTHIPLFSLYFCFFFFSSFKIHCAFTSRNHRSKNRAFRAFFAWHSYAAKCAVCDKMLFNQKAICSFRSFEKILFACPNLIYELL